MTTKPVFAYFSTGCAHAPHHVAETWSKKYKGKFDEGWDRLREETLLGRRPSVSSRRRPS